MVIRKAQTATEYLIILAVVIVIAIVAINTLGGFSGIGATETKKVADYKLQTGTVGIDSFVIGTNSSLFKLKNNYYDTITVTEFRINQQANLTCNSSNTIPSLPVVLNIGQSMIINCSVVNSTSYFITDRQTPVIGISYIDALGATRTAGNVLNYAAVNSSSGTGNQSGNQTYTPNSTVISLRNGLVVYYPLDGNISDLSGNGNTGTNNGATYNSSGKIGGAYSFNGGTNYLSSTLNGFSTTSFHSVFFWVYINSTSQDGKEILEISDGTNCNGNPGSYVGGISSGILEFDRCGDANSRTQVDSLTNLNNSWNYIGYTYSNGNLVTYKNGVLMQNASRTFVSVSSPKMYLFSARNGAQNFAGIADEVSIWNRTLNSTEILQLYNNGTGLSLSLSGAQAPTCAVNQTSCNATIYLTCSNGNWVNNGNVDGQCGYSTPGNVTALRNGLVAYYPLDGNTSDLSGNGNTGTNNGANYTQFGKVGGAYSFDGTNDYLVSSLVTGISNAHVWSINLWAYYNTTGNMWDNMVSLGTASANQIVALARGSTTSSMNINFWSGNNVQNIALGTDLTLGYHMISAVYNGASIDIYFDGIWKYNKVITLSLANTNSYIGGRPGNYDGQYFHGYLDEVTIWNRTLNSSEIVQLYNSSNGFSLSLSGPQAPVCLVNQTSCNGTSYLNCSSGNWVNNGNVSGQCGYAGSGNLSNLRLGLVAYYPFDSDTNDNSSYHRASTNNGGVSAAGKVGGSYFFNVTGNYINASDTGLPMGDAARSFSGWFKVTNASYRSTLGIFSYGTQAFTYKSSPLTLCGGNGLQNGGVPMKSITWAPWGTTVSSARQISDTNWHNFVVTYAGSGNIVFYIDGVNYGMQESQLGSSAVNTVSNGALHLGLSSLYGTADSGFYLDDIAAWNRTLNSTEVAQLYNSGNGISLVQ